MAFVIQNMTLSGEPVQLRGRPLSLQPAIVLTAAPVVIEEQSVPAVAILTEAEILPPHLEMDSAEPVGPMLDIETIRRDIERELLAAQQLTQERLFEEARQQGFDAGYAVGEAAAKQSYQEQHSALANLISGVRDALSRNISGEEDVMVGIAFEAICKIIGTTMHDLEGVRAVVRQVMQSANAKELLMLRVSPGDYSLVQELLQDDERRYGGVKIMQDERVTLGGCLIETEAGTLDGRLDTQMQILRDTLLAAKRWHGDASA